MQPLLTTPPITSYVEYVCTAGIDFDRLFPESTVAVIVNGSDCGGKTDETGQLLHDGIQDKSIVVFVPATSPPVTVAQPILTPSASKQTSKSSVISLSPLLRTTAEMTLLALAYTLRISSDRSSCELISTSSTIKSDSKPASSSSMTRIALQTLTYESFPLLYHAELPGSLIQLVTSHVFTSKVLESTRLVSNILSLNFRQSLQIGSQPVRCNMVSSAVVISSVFLAPIKSVVPTSCGV